MIENGKFITKERRFGLAVWVKNTKTARQLRRYGNVHYVSRRLNYVIVYVNADEVNEIMAKIGRLDFVTRVDRSPVLNLFSNFKCVRSTCHLIGRAHANESF